MIYKSKVEFEDYALNHVVGCSHGCKYPCYAQNIALRMGMIKKRDQWYDPKIKENYESEISKDIKKLKSKIKEVHLCFMTDVFMYRQPQIIKASLKILEMLKISNIKYKTLTKGVIPAEEILEIEKIKSQYLFEEQQINSYGISLVSLDEEFRQKWEPGAAPFLERINAHKNLSENGLNTYVYMEPFSPEDTSFEQFKILLDNIKYTNKIIFGSWQYNKIKSDKKKYPEYVEYFVNFCNDNNISFKIKKEISNSIQV